MVGRSGWTWKGTFYRKNLRNILLMWPLILLRPFLSCVCFYFIITITTSFFFLFSSRLRTHALIYRYNIYPLCIPFLRGNGGVHFLPATSKLEYILYYTHTHTRDSRVHYILFRLRQIDRSFGSHHHHAIRDYIIIYTPFWNVAGITCTRTL